MKKLVLLLLLPTLSFAQLRFNDHEYFTASIISDPTKKAPSIGTELEYVGFIYARAGVSKFTNYSDFIGAIGVNLTSGYFEKVRYYGGIRLGTTKKERANATAGVELGVDFKISDNSFLGFRATYDYKSDFYFNNRMTNNNFIRFGFTF